VLICFSSQNMNSSRCT